MVHHAPTHALQAPSSSPGASIDVTRCTWGNTGCINQGTCRNLAICPCGWNFQSRRQRHLGNVILCTHTCFTGLQMTITSLQEIVQVQLDRIPWSDQVENQTLLFLAHVGKMGKTGPRGSHISSSTAPIKTKQPRGSLYQVPIEGWIGGYLYRLATRYLGDDMQMLTKWGILGPKKQAVSYLDNEAITIVNKLPIGVINRRDANRDMCGLIITRECPCIKCNSPESGPLLLGT